MVAINTDWKVRVFHAKKDERIEYVWGNGYRMKLFNKGYQLWRENTIINERGNEEKVRELLYEAILENKDV